MMKLCAYYTCVIVVVSFLSADVLCASASQLATRRKLQHVRAEQLKKSTECYKAILHKVLPAFEKHMVYKIVVNPGAEHRSTALLMGNPRMSPTTYSIEVREGVPESSLAFEEPVHLMRGSADSFWRIDTCFLTIPPLDSKDSLYGPRDEDEVHFIISRELAHVARATMVRYLVELDPVHNPGLLNDSRYKKYSSLSKPPLETYLKLWPKRAQQHRLNAILLGIRCGGIPAIMGGITYTARRLIYAYHRKEEIQGTSLMSKLVLTRRSRLRKIEATIGEQNNVIERILAWIVTESLEPESMEADVAKVYCDVKIFYDYTVKDMPELCHISERNQVKILNLGNVKRV